MAPSRRTEKGRRSPSAVLAATNAALPSASDGASGSAWTGSPPPVPKLPTPVGPPQRADRSLLLDAAEEVVLRAGIGHLTLDAVARSAGLSKSGLLHHFPSKEALIDALVRRKIDEWRKDVDDGVASQPAGRGQTARSALCTCLSSTERWTDALRRSSVVLVAALVHDSKHIEPLRLAQAEIAKRFESDGLPPGTGAAVHLAINGLWFDWIFGLSDWTPQRLADVRSALERLIESPEPSPARKSTTRSASTRSGTSTRSSRSGNRTRRS